MEANLDKFFDDLREFIIGAVDSPPSEPIPTIMVIASRLRDIYIDFDVEAHHLEVPDGWEEPYNALVAEIDRTFGDGTASGLDGGLGVLDIGPEHFTTE